MRAFKHGLDKMNKKIQTKDLLIFQMHWDLFRIFVSGDEAINW